MFHHLKKKYSITLLVLSLFLGFINKGKSVDYVQERK
jgi:hypothetical protein